MYYLILGIIIVLELIIIILNIWDAISGGNPRWFDEMANSGAVLLFTLGLIIDTLILIFVETH